MKSLHIMGALSLSLLTPVLVSAVRADTSTDSSAVKMQFIGNHYEGTVDSVDPVTGTAAITTRFGQRILTVQTNAGTRIWGTHKVPSETLQVGDKVLVFGRDIDPATVQAQTVDILPDFPTNAQKQHLKGKKKGYQMGTIASLQPTVTLTELDGVVVTLQANKLNVSETALTTVNDILVGADIKVDGAVDGDFITATRIIISPSTPGKSAGKGRRRTIPLADLAPAPTPPAAQPPTAQPPAPTTGVTPIAQPPTTVAPTPTPTPAGAPATAPATPVPAPPPAPNPNDDIGDIGDLL